jgi:hypothetical protein
MKVLVKHIDFDFIGSQEPTTQEDRDLIANYFSTKKIAANSIVKSTVKKRKKKIASKVAT